MSWAQHLYTVVKANGRKQSLGQGSVLIELKPRDHVLAVDHGPGGQQKHKPKPLLVLELVGRSTSLLQLQHRAICHGDAPGF